jgi:hypothetical protein
METWHYIIRIGVTSPESSGYVISSHQSRTTPFDIVKRQWVVIERTAQSKQSLYLVTLSVCQDLFSLLIFSA